MSHHELLEKIQEYRSGLSKLFGGGVGVSHGLIHYWESLTEDDYIKFAMGSLGTLWYTLLGVGFAWFLNKYVFKMGKKQ
jgi:hypothetical protein